MAGGGKVGYPAMGRRREVSWDEIQALRYALYRFFAASLLSPTWERVAWLKAASRALKAQEALLGHFAFYPAWRCWAELLANDTGSLLELETAYTALARVAPPEASLYLDPKGLDRGWILAAIDQKYREAGLVRSPTRAEPPDHLAVELEFMAFLCQQQVMGVEGEARRGACALQRAFLNRHLRRWLPIFVRRVRDRAPSNPYRLAIGAVEAFVIHDADWLELSSG